MEDFIKVKDMNYNIGRKKLIDNVSLKINEGDFVSIIGSNGSGKTTLLKLLAGILPNHNSITFGYSYLDSKNKNKDILKFGFVFNDLNEYLFDDVFKEFSFPLENMKMSNEEIEIRVLTIADFFQINRLLDKKMTDLTKEEKQVLNIAIALVHKPSVLILDNPFSMMKTSTKKIILDKLKKLVIADKLTIIMSTNNLEDILYSNYTYVLNNGSIALEGSTLSILKEDMYLKRLGLELPFAVNLSMMLKFYQILDDYYLDYDEVINKLWN